MEPVEIPWELLGSLRDKYEQIFAEELHGLGTGEVPLLFEISVSPTIVETTERLPEYRVSGSPRGVFKVAFDYGEENHHEHSEDEEEVPYEVLAEQLPPILRILTELQIRLNQELAESSSSLEATVRATSGIPTPVNPIFYASINYASAGCCKRNGVKYKRFTQNGQTWCSWTKC